MSAAEILGHTRGTPEFVLVDDATGDVVLACLDETSLTLVRALSELDQLDASIPLETQRELVRGLHLAAPAPPARRPGGADGLSRGGAAEPVVRLTPLAGP